LICAVNDNERPFLEVLAQMGLKPYPSKRKIRFDDNEDE